MITLDNIMFTIAIIMLAVVAYYIIKFYKYIEDLIDDEDDN